jgi:hypothetical protein
MIKEEDRSCDVCGTKLTAFNATNNPGLHDIRNCAQVLLAQRDDARRCAEIRLDAYFANWEDRQDEWSNAISKAHPARNGSTDQDHDRYGVAMRMVSNRHSKSALVALVNWLLVERDATLSNVEGEDR